MSAVSHTDPADPENSAHRGEPLLSVRGLTIEMRRAAGVVTFVNELDFDIWPGEIFGLVGESGSGKSLTCLALMDLLPKQMTVRGSIRFRGRPLADIDDTGSGRRNSMGMIFQNPTESLNPVKSIGAQIFEVLRLHRDLVGAAARDEACGLLRRVGLPEPMALLRRYPHQLSGGMNQRVMIALALAAKPALLIADEPTTALDVTIQAQILDLLNEIRDSDDLAVLLVSHDLGLIAERADRTAVIYAGRIVEQARVGDLFGFPGHPYVKLLIAALPRLGDDRERLPMIPGQVPSPGEWGAGCNFSARCPGRKPLCRHEIPSLRNDRLGHSVACHFSLHAVSADAS
ncbi:MAG: ABC transporter ATP-binding protein [Alphaproteobacteria bacterium]|nr:ABC transporter ATP-binding protein [Alphaproteobacteria bacterium]